MHGNVMILREVIIQNWIFSHHKITILLSSKLSMKNTKADQGNTWKLIVSKSNTIFVKCPFDNETFSLAYNV